jgi:hypothetical protein
MMLLLVVALVAIFPAAIRSSYYTSLQEPIPQPIPFGHDHHVGAVGIDCRFCHTTVETTDFAGIPATETCMGCHDEIWADAPMLKPVHDSWNSGEPIAWTRVHDLPDHSIHIHKGVGCSTCHGRVDLMPLVWKTETLLMEWCLDCHRDPAPFLRPPSKIYEMDWDPSASRRKTGIQLMKDYEIDQTRLTDCYTCHR